jgi:hypothetical protein
VIRRAGTVYAEPVHRSNRAAKRHTAKFGREYAEAGYSLNQLLAAATWADEAAIEGRLAVLAGGRLAWWELEDCGSALGRAMRRRALPDFATRFESLTKDNLVWPELREADDFCEETNFPLSDWRE